MAKRKEETGKTERCVICGSEMESRQSCNPFPIREEGSCCLLCDHLLVTPARMAMGGLRVSPQILRLITQLKDPAAKLRIEVIGGEKHDENPD